MGSETLIVVDILAQRLTELGITYYIGGSVASSFYGLFRATNDADIIVDLKEEHIPALLVALNDDFYIDEDMIRSALTHSTSFNVIHYQTMVKADLFPTKSSEFGKSELDRRRKQQIQITATEQTIYFASAEDMVIQKLLWYRETGERSDRQWGDVQGILKVQASALDFPYMHHWAQNLSLTDLLNRALMDAGIEPR